MTLTKARLAQKVQSRVYDVKPWEAQQLVERVIEIMKDALANGEDVLITGFGKFAVRHKNSRRGRNPQTGDSLILAERRVVVFRPSGVLRRRLQGEISRRR